MENRDFIIIGAGSSLNSYKKKISNLIKDKNLESIGINYMTHLFVPDYHLWTNKKRYTEFGNCIRTGSKLIFGYKMSKQLIRQHYSGKYETVCYAEGTVGVNEYGTILGSYRTAGLLAIMIAHVKGAKNIYIVGMDGYTFHNKRSLKSKEDQHCYGSGFTDDGTWKECCKKDEIVDMELRAIRDAGVNFDIITPTKFETFYNRKILND